jgi:hypothetical protein
MYVDSLLAPGQSVRDFCARRGLDNARVSAWRKGTDVTVDQMREFGLALGLRLGQVMVIAGYGTAADFGEGAVPPPPPPAPLPPPPAPTIEELLDAEGFTVEEKEAVINLVNLLRGARSGRSGTYVSRRSKRPTPK